MIRCFSPYRCQGKPEPTGKPMGLFVPKGASARQPAHVGAAATPEGNEEPKSAPIDERDAFAAILAWLESPRDYALANAMVEKTRLNVRDGGEAPPGWLERVMTAAQNCPAQFKYEATARLNLEKVAWLEAPVCEKAPPPACAVAGQPPSPQVGCCPGTHAQGGVCVLDQTTPPVPDPCAQAAAAGAADGAAGRKATWADPTCAKVYAAAHAKACAEAGNCPSSQAAERKTNLIAVGAGLAVAFGLGYLFAKR